MDNIKSLYMIAKNSGKEKDIALYKESVNALLESNPIEYFTNLEYIISSDIGLKSFDEFVKRYGIPLPAYDYFVEHLEKARKKCRMKEINDEKYTACIANLESFRKQYQHCFAIFEYHNEHMGNSYIEAYYKLFPLFKNHSINKIDFSGFISKYGNGSIPDILIYNEKTGHVEEIVEKLISVDPLRSQELLEMVKDIDINVNNLMYENSLDSIITSLKNKNESIFKEAVILEKNPEEIELEYSEEDIEFIKDLISLKEYMITSLEDTNEIMKIQSEVYSLYENFSNIIEDVADSVIPNLPQNINERLASTSNKRTGDVPGYIKQNHSISTYGEDDPDSKKDDSELDIEDYKRSSKKDNSQEDDEVQDKIEDLKDDIKDAKTPEEKEKAINNYYYYTYTNSNNKNVNSYNKNRSVSDDHSTNKRIHSNDINKSKDDNEDIEKYDTESYNEEVGDVDDDKPTSDHPIKDTLTDIDRTLTSAGQKVKKGVQDVSNVGRIFVKPFKRTAEWINNMINQWKDKEENDIKEKLADPRARAGLWNAVKTAILGGSLFKAGLLLNPFFLFFTLTKHVGKDKKIQRIRNEMIGELKTELEVINEKIKDADSANDNKAKYQLMRFRNEINKKLIRVGGLRRERNMI